MTCMRIPLKGKRCRRTFTLIEMLVVIAIIGILAALLMPTLQGALETARQTGCLNNKKQIGTAFSLYAEDNRFLPDYQYPDYDGDGVQEFTRWYNLRLIGRYISTIENNTGNRVELLFCPSYPPQTPYRAYNLASGYNYYNGNQINRINGSKGVLPFIAFRSPSRLILVTDVGCSFRWVTFDRYEMETDGNGIGCYYRHAGKTVTLFAAGNAGVSSDLQADNLAGRVVGRAQE